MHDPDKIRQVLEPLEKSLEADYPQQDLVKQREAFLELLGSLRDVIRTLGNAFGRPEEERLRILQPIIDWYNRHASVMPLFPDAVGRSIHMVTTPARACLKDPVLKQLQTAEVIETFDFHWSILEGYENL